MHFSVVFSEENWEIFRMKSLNPENNNLFSGLVDDINPG